MSTADTINSIRTHLENDYEGLENLGVTAEDRNIENIRTCLDEIYDNIPKTTDTGTNLSLNTIKGKMNIIPKGDTQQTQYSGYNKINTANATIGYKPEGTTITIDSEGVINASTNVNYASINLPSMTLSSGKTYTFKRNFTGSYNSYLVDTNGENILVIGYNATSKTITPESDITINKLNGALVSGDNYFWLYEGTTDKTYEPYVGGTASPNPTYPQDIEVVTGTQEVKIENINKLPYAESGTHTSNGATHTSNGNGIYTINGTATGTSYYNWEITPYTIKSGDYLHIGNSSTNSNIAIALLENSSTQITSSSPTIANRVVDLSSYVGRTITIVRTYTTAQTLSNFELKPMICNSNTATPYTPHQEQTQVVSLGDIELCKIGNYQDYLYKSNDKWYKKEQIGKTRLTGTAQTWASGVTSINEKKRYYTDSFMNIIVKPSSVSVIADILNNYYKPQVASSQGSYGGKQGISVDAGGRIYINDDNYQDNLDGWKTWLNGVICELYYALQTANDIEITNETLIEQLDNLEKLKSYNGVTNISSSGNLSAILSVSALKGE